MLKRGLCAARRDRHSGLRFETGFGDAENGSSAVEFAIVLPLLILLYAGVVDLTRAAIESGKVQNVSNTISDLVSQQPTQKQLSPGTIASILDSATAIMAPYPAARVTMTVSAVTLTPKANGTCCDARVLWSYTQGGSLRPCGAPLQQVPSNAPPAPDRIPAPMVQSIVLGPYSNAAIIIADVHDTYQPQFRQMITILSGAMDRTTYAVTRGQGLLNVKQPFAPTVPGQSAISCS